MTLDPQALSDAIAAATGRKVLELTVTQAQDTQDASDGPNATIVAGLEHHVTVTALLEPPLETIDVTVVRTLDLDDVARQASQGDAR